MPQAYGGTYTFTGLTTNTNYIVFVSTWDVDNGQWRDYRLTVPTALPLGGYESDYIPGFWNQSSIIEKANCYTYALSFGGTPLDPGWLAEDYSLNKSCLSQQKINTLILKDAPYLYELGLASNQNCWHNSSKLAVPSNGYKVALVIALGKDYHFYRQDSNGYWSHKRGKGSVCNVDASGNLIADPQACDRNYTDVSYDYSVFCDFYVFDAK